MIQYGWKIWFQPQNVMYSQSYGPKFPNGPYEFLSIAEQSMGGGYYADKNPILNWNGHFFLYLSRLLF